MPPNKCILFYLFTVLFAADAAAQYQIKGTVLDKDIKTPLSGVMVSLTGDGFRENNVFTDAKGTFVLNGNEDSLQVIHVTYDGYLTATDTVRDRQPIVVLLQKPEANLEEVVITANRNPLYSTKILTQLDLNAHPARSAQDLLRLVPGLFVAQHQGGGKAEGIALRGFDADHGTDFSISVDGMPVNLPAHAHGQGYADLHFLIPELVADYEWGKGPYYSSKGDYTTAGFVNYNTKDFLQKNFLKIEGGRFTTGRLVGAVNLLSSQAATKGQSLYVAGDATYTNGGPFTVVPEHFRRYNLFGKFITPLGEKNTLTVIGSTMWSKWRSSGEIPERAVTEGYIDSRWGAFDTNQTGVTARTNAIVKLKTVMGENLVWNNEAFYSNYRLNLYTNFSAYYFYPEEGDEFRQFENRNLFGYHSTLSQTNYVGNAVFSTNYGIGFRTDLISPLGLDHTEDGAFLENIQKGNAKETNMYTFIDENIHLGKWLFNVGLRYDYFSFYYRNLSTNSIATNIFGGLPTSAHDGIVSPKINVEYTFNPTVQLYLKTGKGFHSNDVRVVIAQQGNDILPAVYGSDLGINWKPFPRLFINSALWYLFMKTEFTYGSDLIDQPGGPMEASGRTVRYGIDVSGRYQMLDWLYAGLNLNYAHPRSIDDPKGENYIPLAPNFTSTGELNFRFKNGLNGGISYRYMHDRPGNEDYSLTCKGYFVTDLTVNYTRKKYEVSLAIENLFNTKWDEVQRNYISQFKGEAHAVDEMSYIPGVPFFPKLKLTWFF